MKLFIDYSVSVRDEYEKKKAANAISLNLIYPTSVKLKEECILVCQSKFRTSDHMMLKSIFGPSSDMQSALQIINKCDPDKLKPLVNYLKGNTTRTDEKNIELLAWLIDFEPRPFVVGGIPKETSVIEPEKQITGEPEKKEGLITLGGAESENKKQDQLGRNIRYSRKKVLTIVVILVLVVGGVFWLQTRQPLSQLPAGHEKCMFWSGDHYQLISCSQKMGDTLVVAFDSIKLTNFKKITRPDTITGRSKGRVWYIKLKGELEFYTSDGSHPVEYNRKLKPITDYIINKYINTNLVRE